MGIGIILIPAETESGRLLTTCHKLILNKTEDKQSHGLAFLIIYYVCLMLCNISYLDREKNDL